MRLSNPGAQVGGGAGLLGGLATAFFFALSPVAVIAAAISFPEPAILGKEREALG